MEITGTQDKLSGLLTGAAFVTLEFSIPPGMKPEYASLWRQHLEETSAATAADGNEPPDEERSELLFLELFLAMARILLQVGRVPVFDRPEIRKVEVLAQPAKKYRAQVGFPLLGSIPPLVYKLVSTTTLELCPWMLVNAPTDANRETLYKTVQEKVLTPLYRLVPAGKSTIPVLRVAHSMGVPFVHLGMGVYQIGWGSKARRLNRSITELDSAIGSQLAQNKTATANLLSMAGLPAPYHAIVGSEEDAIGAASKIGFPVVVKPSDRDRGEGVTVDVSDNDSLKTAFKAAQALTNSKQVIVERQVPGVCHRLFIAAGKMLYAVKRLPMSVRGDGVRSVQQLVDEEIRLQGQRPPWNRSEIKPIDELAIRAMGQAGFAPDTVPGEGMLVPLRRIESTEWGGVDEEVTYAIHPENLDVAIRAAELFGLHVAGIDIITPDITKPWFENGAIVNEVNFAPLFGGAEISRSYIPQFLSEFVVGDGRIPLEIRGTEAEARSRQKEHVEMGRRCFFTTAEMTIDPRGKELRMPFGDLKRRLRALMCRPDVDAVVMVHC